MEIDINNIDIILCLGCDGCANFSLENSTFIYSNQICDSDAVNEQSWHEKSTMLCKFLQIIIILMVETYSSSNKR